MRLILILLALSFAAAMRFPKAALDSSPPPNLNDTRDGVVTEELEEGAKHTGPSFNTSSLLRSDLTFLNSRHQVGKSAKVAKAVKK